MEKLTLNTLTAKQKEFLEDGNEKESFDGIKIIKRKHKFVEYGDSLNTVTFTYDGLMYECAYVFESGPGTTDWDSHNAAAETCYLEIVVPKKPAEKFHLIIGTSLRGMGDVSLTVRNVPDELHKRILEKYGSYQEMIEEGHVDEYEEFLNLESIRPVEVFSEENE